MLGRAFLVLATGSLAALALVTSAAGTTSAHSEKKHLQVAVAALAMDGDRIAYDASSKIVAKPRANKVLVWNVRTGKTVKVSGKKTAAADTSSTGGGVFQLAIAGSRVAWLMNLRGNLEGDDYLFTSSLTKPKEHQVASAMRHGTFCPGRSVQGGRLVVSTKNQQLLVYDARTGSLRKSLAARGQANNPKNLDVQGKIAIYTTGNVGELHAVNLSTGKDRVIAKLHGGVGLAQIDSAGLAYAGNGSGTSYGKATLVFKPLSLLKAAVS